MITLRQMRYLTAVADTLNFSRAAEMCFVTQPTLSAGIKELEDRLGAQLVERTRRNVMLTPLGEDITMRARRLLLDAAEIERARRPRDRAFQIVLLAEHALRANLALAFIAASRRARASRDTTSAPVSSRKGSATILQQNSTRFCA